ncbi:MAG TPA: phosphoribosylamine--glycine ligase [Pyrinomonadaceae bacterium]|nr:phosphoribosylamine--glycine ligase [Pyrinomonadaceae bacterium]
MKILVVGSGGREHALCRAFSQSSRVKKVYCANGNAGIASVAECVDIKPEEIEKLADFAAENRIDLTFVGGETSLALGIVDLFESRLLKIIGPTKEAARLEASKAYAKDLMKRYGIPTAAYRKANSPREAIYILEKGFFGGEAMPVVIKADGLAAGKGVVVAANRAEAIVAINGLESLVGAEASGKIIIEERLVGEEVSLLLFSDGHKYALMPATRDHKRIGEGDTGPNTGGMGAITDDALLDPSEISEIEVRVIMRTLDACNSEGFDFKGIMFLGLMMTDDGPKVLEYNVRFGDPETQAILVRLETDLVDICEAMLEGRIKELDIKWREGSSACVVLASEGYPGKARTGDVIQGLNEAEEVGNVAVFHAGTAFGKDGDIVTAGGRVLGVTATGADRDEALSWAYEAVEEISWPGMQYRRDIGK